MIKEEKCNRIDLVFRLLLGALLSVWFVMHPRVNYGLMLFFWVWQIVVLLRKKKPSVNFLKSLICLVLLWYFGTFLNIFLPYHAPYEYKSDISELKMKKYDAYAHFPDTIPKGAKRLKWINMPSILQGSGYEGLFFYIDSSYLEEVYAEYKSAAKIYRAIDSPYEKFEVDFPLDELIPAGTEQGVAVLMLYDNQDWNHPRKYGMYLNIREGYICYFSE